MAKLDLAGLWDSVAQSADNDRDYLNRLDQSNGNAGDNYAANMQLVARTLDRELKGGRGDAGQALEAAAEQLRQHGRGATAPIYADGLANAAGQFRGRSGLDAGDLLPLLQGLLSGAQGSSSAKPQGQGGLLDALVPGVLGYLSAKQQGMSDTEALMSALGAAQGGMGGLLGSPGGGLGALGGLLNPQQPGQNEGTFSNAPQGGLGGLFGAPQGNEQGGFGAPQGSQGGLFGAPQSGQGGPGALLPGGQSQPAPAPLQGMGGQGQANAGAAGVGSLLQGMLQSMLAQRGQQDRPQAPRRDKPDWGGQEM